MKSFYPALLAVLILPLFSFGQSNYKPGYVVTLKGDTLKGFIDYREWNSNPNAINFKTAVADSKARELTPEEINVFNINNRETYQRYAGLISMDATDVDHIESVRDTSTRAATVFLKVLQKGNNLALYSYTDELKTRVYVGEAPDYAPQELVYRLFNNFDGTVQGQKGTTVNENTYMKQLFALANKYQALNSDLQWDIERGSYNTDKILDIVSKINHISKAEYKKSKANNGPAFNLFVGAGVNIDNFSPSSDGPYYSGGGRSQTSYLPAASFGINFFANPNTRQLQFRIEAGITQGQYKYAYNLQVSPYIPFKASFNQLAISITPQVLYNFYNAENFKIYGDFGFSFSHYSYSNAYLGSQSQPNSATDIETNNPYVFHSADNSFLLKAGVQIHKNWGIYAQYLSGVSVTQGGYFQMGSTCEQVGINYFF
jgi:hypothetical protein